MYLWDMVKKKEEKGLNRIAEVLEEKGVSQYRLHKDSGVSYSLINNYVANAKQPTLETLKKLADALGYKSLKDFVN
jgi:transcriptional regulator with XRE-family HTH domain